MNETVSDFDREPFGKKKQIMAPPEAGDVTLMIYSEQSQMSVSRRPVVF